MATKVEGKEGYVRTSVRRIPGAAWYALAVLTLANTFNYLDRHIVSILAQSIKTDLKLDDADLGFILGTAFATFYSVVGVAMGRISDSFPRKKLMAFGLALWSGMTALGGTATSFSVLALARVGVGVGEAVAGPCSHSLLVDTFPANNRAVALSTYLAGIFIGGAAASLLGGYFVQYWGEICFSVPIAGACRLAGWQAALFAVGLPGIPLALLLLAIQEPRREGPRVAGSMSIVVSEISAALPPFTLLVLFRAGGRPALLRNLVFTVAIAAASAALIAITGDFMQWASLGFGTCAVVTWGQIQSLRDRPLFSLTFGDQTFLMVAAIVALLACMCGAVSAWAAPYAMRTFDLTPAQIGFSLGLIYAVAGVVGIILGGWLTDRWKARDLRAPICVAAISLAGLAPSIALMLIAGDVIPFLLANFAIGVFGALTSGAFAALIQDLVLPRMRGAAAASYSVIAIVVSSGLGPYWAGKVSVLTGSLRAGLFSILLLAPGVLLLLWLTARRLPFETPEARWARAHAAGEPV